MSSEPANDHNSLFTRHNLNRPKPKMLDGIVRRGQTIPGQGRIDFRRANSYQPRQPQTIGDFSKPEGYHPTDQGLIATKPREQIAKLAVETDESKPKIEPKFSRKQRRRQRPKSWRRTVWRTLSVFFIAILITGSFLFIKTYIKARQVFRGGSAGAVALEDNVDPSRLKGEGDGRINVLILGRGGEGHTAPDLTDTILIASIDPINKEAGILSIPRDLYVKVPDNGSMKINSVYARAKQTVLASGKQSSALSAKAEKAGNEAIEKTIQDILGIPLHYRVMVDFKGFKQAVDAVGGVDINVPSSVYESMRIDGKQYVLNVKPGVQHFDGFRALAYARSRYTSPRGDFDRAERQRLIILALKDKILSAGTYSNPNKISQLLDAFGNHVSTNMSIDHMLRMAEITKGIPSNKTKSLGFADPPNNLVTTANVGGQSVVVPRAGTGNFKAIQSFVRNELKDGYLKYENASVAVLNGTANSGVATAKADELKSFGYNVSTIADAPTKTYKKTILVDMRGGSKKYTRHYLQKRFGVSAVESLPDPNINPGNADFVIIIAN